MTLEKVIIKIHPMNERNQPYIITFEHTTPNYIAQKLQKKIYELLRSEYIAEGVENIRVV